MRKITFEYIKKILAKNKKKLLNFDIKTLKVFGSVARGKNNGGSDIDFLVEFNSAPTFNKMAGLHLFLTDLFPGTKVDLVRGNILRQEIKDEVYSEALDAA